MWIDDGTTALCPHCGIDAVLPSKSTNITEEHLKEMHDYRFRSIRPMT